MKLLKIDSSIQGGQSVSRLLTSEIVAHLHAGAPKLDIASHDLAAGPVAHLERRPPDREDLLEEFLAADIVVIGAPMYNFSIPTQLKAWIDRISVAGRTFVYGEHGPKGLLDGKRVILALASGGAYGPGTPAHGLEHQQSYLRSVFTFLGARIEAIVAEGINQGPDGREKALAAARAQIASL